MLIRKKKLFGTMEIRRNDIRRRGKKGFRVHTKDKS